MRPSADWAIVFDFFAAQFGSSLGFFAALAGAAAPNRARPATTVVIRARLGMVPKLSAGRVGARAGHRADSYVERRTRGDAARRMTPTRQRPRFGDVRPPITWRDVAAGALA